MDTDCIDLLLKHGMEKRRNIAILRFRDRAKFDEMDTMRWRIPWRKGPTFMKEGWYLMAFEYELHESEPVLDFLNEGDEKGDFIFTAHSPLKALGAWGRAVLASPAEYIWYSKQ